jgi:hypothetical protein
MLFEQFSSALPRVQLATSSQPWLDDYLVRVTGYREFAYRWAGATFERGLYRIVDSRSGALVAQLVSEAFPDFHERVHAFGYDWLGRVLAVDSGRTDKAQPLVLLLEPGTGEAIEVPYSFLHFHENLTEIKDAALASNFFVKWSKQHGSDLPLPVTKCVGYSVPLFLGGRDVIENLELIDMDVYWTVCGQLKLGTSRLPPGSTIKEVSIGR